MSISKLEENLSQLLDIRAREEEEERKGAVTVLPPAPPSQDDIDFEMARTNIKELIKKGTSALDGVIDLAHNGEHPRAYEVAGQIIKTLVDANRDLLGIHKSKKELHADEQQAPRSVTNQAVFVGSTAELQKMLKAKSQNGESE